MNSPCRHDIAAIIVLIFAASPAWSDTPGLQQGAKALKAGEAEKAIKLFSAELATPELSLDDRARAFYLRAKAYYAAKQPSLAIGDVGAALWLKKLSPADAADAATIRGQALAEAMTTHANVPAAMPAVERPQMRTTIAPEAARPAAVAEPAPKVAPEKTTVAATPPAPPPAPAPAAPAPVERHAQPAPTPAAAAESHPQPAGWSHAQVNRSWFGSSNETTTTADVDSAPAATAPSPAETAASVAPDAPQPQPDWQRSSVKRASLPTVAAPVATEPKAEAREVVSQVPVKKKQALPTSDIVTGSIERRPPIQQPTAQQQAVPPVRAPQGVQTAEQLPWQNSSVPPPEPETPAVLPEPISSPAPEPSEAPVVGRSEPVPPPEAEVAPVSAPSSDAVADAPTGSTQTAATVAESAPAQPQSSSPSLGVPDITSLFSGDNPMADAVARADELQRQRYERIRQMNAASRSASGN